MLRWIFWLFVGALIGVIVLPVLFLFGLFLLATLVFLPLTIPIVLIVLGIVTIIVGILLLIC